MPDTPLRLRYAQSRLIMNRSGLGDVDIHMVLPVFVLLARGAFRVTGSKYVTRSANSVAKKISKFDSTPLSQYSKACAGSIFQRVEYVCITYRARSGPQALQALQALLHETAPALEDTCIQSESYTPLLTSRTRLHDDRTLPASSTPPSLLRILQSSHSSLALLLQVRPQTPPYLTLALPTSPSLQSPTMFPSFPLQHIPPLFIATATSLGGLLPLWNAQYAIEEFGLPRRVAVSKPAQSIMILSSARISVIGAAMLIFYARGQYADVDLMMVLLGYVGAIDGYVCWLEGVPGRGVFRGLAGGVVAALGWFGVTAGSEAW